MTTEPELFAAYQSLGHYKAACACGDDIRAETSDERTVGAAIRLHNLSPLHQQWREWQDDRSLCPDCLLPTYMDGTIRRDGDGWRHYCYPGLKRQVA